MYRVQAGLIDNLPGTATSSSADNEDGHGHKRCEKPDIFPGNFFTQPNNPLAPLSRPVISNVANMEKAVISVGTTTAIVNVTWRYFQGRFDTWVVRVDGEGPPE